MKEVLTKLVRAFLLLAALSGLVIFLVGALAVTRGESVALPGLGIIIDGVLVVIIGAPLLVVSLALYWGLGARQNFR